VPTAIRLSPLTSRTVVASANGTKATSAARGPNRDGVAVVMRCFDYMAGAGRGPEAKVPSLGTKG